MYQEKDHQDIRAQLRARLWAVLTPAVVLLIATFVCFFMRGSQLLTMALCVLACSVCIFGYSMFIAPVNAYQKHIDHALHGRTRTVEGTFVAMEEESVVRDGLMFYPMTINVGDPSDEKDDRLFYFDANLPRPGWTQGIRLAITSYDNRVTNWERA